MLSSNPSGQNQQYCQEKNNRQMNNAFFCSNHETIKEQFIDICQVEFNKKKNPCCKHSGGDGKIWGMRKFSIIFVLLSAVCLFADAVFAQTNDTCIIYFTSLGCSSCSRVGPLVTVELPQKYSNFVVIEYDISQEPENAAIMYEYFERYNVPLVDRLTPFVLIDEDIYLSEDDSILKGLENLVSEKKSNTCPLLDASLLSGKPKIYPESKAKEFETSKDIVQQNLTLAKVISLAAVDAVNPCALAVLTLMLLGVLAYNPGDKRKVLFAGLAFCLSVFVMYFFYGLIIVRLFQLVQALSNIRLWLYKILGVLAIILGILNLKDFIRYKPGTLGTEMPMFLRPKMQNLLFKVTSPKAAFVIGAFVTLFLLPCTIGPYIICAGILCSLSLFKALPWLFLYNAVFILPMLVITAVCFIGLSSVENIPEWRERNIRPLHLIAGVIILALGLAMVLGLV